MSGKDSLYLAFIQCTIFFLILDFYNRSLENDPFKKNIFVTRQMPTICEELLTADNCGCDDESFGSEALMYVVQNVKAHKHTIQELLTDWEDKFDCVEVQELLFL